MTKHDTWVKLKPDTPYEPILDLFPDGLPMRDPFPLEKAMHEGKVIPLWIVDLKRLNDIQANALAQLIALLSGAASEAVMQEAIAKGGFGMGEGWIESVLCDAEGIQRSKELADFFETAPQAPSKEAQNAWANFYNSQHERWIEGEEVPPAINSIEDVDPRLRTPELERAFKMRQIEFAIAQGNYSVMDVLSGRAMTDVLNIIDPENSYSLVGDDDFDDDEFDDDEIYE
ncbi:MAG: hypothetical protein RM022_014830 [Nostoc sp. EfeVER01]|uniref:hypothetical protein n=1 Tax=unclassified Nostoc TaxID=2593658 RepID=UPI002AD4F86A|nr:MULTISPECIES: hypothetical protein [unclassified Nostoc]MDZ7946088.1 hypothetical protein [Nostoc sp. EfeVER01]MDZ7992045.1 hypothetical protein [Nostoc sp. EspVER01]